MGWSRHRRKRYTNWSQHHATERGRVAALYGGVDADVRQVFFSMPEEALDRVLADYKKQHGGAKGGYAKKQYHAWRAGTVQMSGEVSERLLAIVPRHLDFGVKYDLLEKLCRRRQATRLKVEVGSNVPAQQALETVLRQIDNVRSAELPKHIAERLAWLSDSDGQVAQALLSQVLDREYQFISDTLRQELSRLLAISSDVAGRLKCKPVGTSCCPGWSSKSC